MPLSASLWTTRIDYLCYKGILDDSVEYVIAVATPLQIIFIAASNTAHANNHAPQHDANKAEGYQYFATRATISTDEVRCRKMFSTEDGRLFLISNDGSLHEIFLAVRHVPKSNDVRTNASE